MKAAITRAANGPIDIVEIVDPGRRSGEVLVRVHAASVNRLDLAVYRGVAMGGVATFPLIQGIDASGVVVEGTGADGAGAPGGREAFDLLRPVPFLPGGAQR